MRSLTVLSRPAAPVIAVAGLIVAFVLAPPVLAGGDFADERHLTEALRGAFVTYWQSGRGDLTPDLAGITDYWFRFHVVKGVIAAVLLAVLVVLLRTTTRKLVLVPVTALAGLALVSVMANVQGMVAPFASLLPMVVEGAPRTATLDQIRHGLAAGDQAPALRAMIADFGLYHEAMIVIAGLVAVGLLIAGVLLWRRAARAFGVLCVVAAVIFAVVAVGNTTVASDPAPALLAFFNGGW